MLVAMSTGGVYRTTDGGATWQAAQQGHRGPLRARPVPRVRPVRPQGRPRRRPTPARLYLQYHHGVYRSDDDGASWQSIADGLPTDFGFTVLTHPRRAGAALARARHGRRRADPAGRASCSCSTRPTPATTWQTQAQGLPHPSYTCVLRDAAAVDTARARPASTSAPATATSSPRRRGRDASPASSSSCPTCCACGSAVLP